MVEEFKRHTAYKLKIGDILSGSQITDGERLKFIEVNGTNVARVNLIANIIDKYVQEGDKNYGTITLDDATGNIKAKFFGDDIQKIKDLNQGDTILLIGLLRIWNNEVYITPEIMKKKSSHR